MPYTVIVMATASDPLLCNSMLLCRRSNRWVFQGYRPFSIVHLWWPLKTSCCVSWSVIVITPSPRTWSLSRRRLLPAFPFTGKERQGSFLPTKSHVKWMIFLNPSVIWWKEAAHWPLYRSLRHRQETFPLIFHQLHFDHRRPDLPWNQLIQCRYPSCN